MRFPVLLGVIIWGASLLAGCAPVVQSPSPGASPSTRTTGAPAPRAAVGANMRVGMLVPLSGPHAALGQSLLEASQLALYESASNDVALITQDTAGNPERAAAAARAAIRDGASLLIGPVFSAEVEAVKPVARALGVPLVSLSNNTALADGNSFMLGLSPREQVARALDFAARHNITRMAVLAPRSPYGEAALEAVYEATTQGPLTLVQATRYEPEAFSGAVAAEFMRALDTAGGAEALVLPEGGATLVSIVTSLTTAGLDLRRTRLLGTSLWQEPGAPPAPQLEGAWFAGPNRANRQAFIQRYQQAYGHTPASIAPLAYDATALSVAVAKAGAASPGATLNRITRPQGFNGVDGLFRFRPTGVAERSLTVFEVTPSLGTQVLDPSPRMF